MNNNEFQKLDSFMARNIPGMSGNLRQETINRQKSFGWLEYVFALGLSCIISYGVIEHHHSKYENAAALSEVLEWNFTSDGDLEELDAIAMLEQ